MIVCSSSQQYHSKTSLDQSDRKSEWKYSAIKYTVDIQVSAHLNQSQKKKKPHQFKIHLEYSSLLPRIEMNSPLSYTLKMS